ncbi:MAG: acyl-CoA dehydrogenase family protein [Hyphomicrobiaceae bacterium]|nr:acyl-CoA dehydrogenase family protein [Hyphomicrobiaceae bacterium]
MDRRAAKSMGSDHIARARELVVLLRSAAPRIEAERELPSDVLAALHGAGLFRLLLPRSIGGLEVDLVTFAEIAQIVASADASTAWCVGQGGGCAMSASFLEPAAAKRLFGPPDAVLAWGAGVQGKAVEVPGGYRVSGRWSFASGSRHATMLGAHCKIFGADGEPKLRPDGRQADRTALIPRSKARIEDVWQVVGLKGTGSDSYSVEDLFVPADETIDREALDTAREKGTLYRFPTIMIYAAAFGGVMLGISRGMLDDLRTLAGSKTARGAASPMRDSEMFQGELGRLEARWRALRAYHFGTFRGIWEAVDAGNPLTLDHRVDARLACTHTVYEGCQIAVDTYRAAGQNAIFENAPFERRLRDALSASQQVQGRPSHYASVARHLLGLPLDTTMFV